MNVMGISIKHIRNDYLKVINYGIYHGNGSIMHEEILLHGGSFLHESKKSKRKKKKR